MGLLGDIIPHQYPVVEILNNASHLVGMPVRVPTHETMNTPVATWDDPAIALGQYTDIDPQTEVVRPRNLQLVPGRLASLLVHRHRVRAKDAYVELVGTIQAKGALEQAYGDVITWLKVACTARGGGGAQNRFPSVMQKLTLLFLPPAEVYEY